MYKFEEKTLPTLITHASVFCLVSNILSLPQTVVNDANLEITVLHETLKILKDEC